MDLPTTPAECSGFLPVRNSMLQRKISKKDCAGYLLAFAGFSILIAHQDGGIQNPAVLYMALCAFSLAVTTLFVEHHPESNKAVGVRARMRFTGVVLLTTAATFFAASWALTGLTNSLSPLPENSFLANLARDLPVSSDFTTIYAWIFGAIAGIFFRAPTMYLSYYSIRLIKADNYLMTTSLLPFLCLGLESIVGLLGNLDTSSLHYINIMAGVLITSGALFTVVMRTIAHRHKLEIERQKQDPLLKD